MVDEHRILQPVSPLPRTSSQTSETPGPLTLAMPYLSSPPAE